MLTFWYLKHQAYYIFNVQFNVYFFFKILAQNCCFFSLRRIPNKRFSTVDRTAITARVYHMLRANDNVSLVCFSAAIQHVRHVKATERQVYHRDGQRREPVLATRLPIVRKPPRFFSKVLRVLNIYFWRVAALGISKFHEKSEHANNRPAVRAENESFKSFTSCLGPFFNWFIPLFP